MKMLINVTGMTDTHCDRCQFMMDHGCDDSHADCELFKSRAGWYSIVKLDKNRQPLRRRQCLNAEKNAKVTK